MTRLDDFMNWFFEYVAVPFFGIVLVAITCAMIVGAAVGCYYGIRELLTWVAA